MTIVTVKTVPGRTKEAVEECERFRGCRMGGHGGIGFVADVVIAGDVVRRNIAGAYLIARFDHRAFEVRRFGVFLDEVAHVDDKVSPNIGYLLQGNAGALGLHAARFKFEGAVAHINHVMRVGDDHAFKSSGGEMGFVEDYSFSAFHSAIFSSALRRSSRPLSGVGSLMRP